MFGNEFVVLFVYVCLVIGDCLDEVVRKECMMGLSVRFVDEDIYFDFSKVVVIDGQVGYDVVGLFNKIGNVMIDLGFVNMVFCELQIIYIDGEQGVLCYCGYLIEQFVEQLIFFEIVYFVFYGELLSKV